MIYFYCTSWQFFHIIVKWRISPTTEQIMFTFSILLFHFYSHIPCGMWLSYIWSIKITKIISTHTSRVGCDNGDIDYECPLCGFLLTHPVWDVTEPSWESLDLLEISTHTSRVGCDTGWNWFPTRSKWISTHTSRVGCDFATGRITEEQYNISTHTSRVGCDKGAENMSKEKTNFYSHIPCGMWPNLAGKYAGY